MRIWGGERLSFPPQTKLFLKRKILYLKIDAST